MIVLGIETATPLLGAALVDGRGVLGECVLRRDRAHAERLLELVAAVLDGCGVDRADVGGVAVSAGPGSFTGLRIGMAAAKAWAFAAGAAFCAVPTLDALALQAGAAAWEVAGAAAPGAATLCPVVDARRGQVYYAFYRAFHRPDRAAAATAEEFMAALASVPGPVCLFGDGLAVGGLEDAARGVLGGRAVRLDPIFDLPRPAAVAAIGRRRLLAGRGDDPYAAAPLYVAVPAARPFAAGRQGGARR